MPRPRRRNRTTLSLFPFLSVLACIIGTLTLLITAAALGEMGFDAVDLEHFDAVAQRVADARRQLARLDELEAEAAALDATLRDARPRHATLAARRAHFGERALRNAPLQRELETSEQELDALRRELEEARRERDGLAQKLRERRDALAEAPILIEPSGSGTGLDPHFVECQRERIVLYEGPERRPVAVRSAAVASSPDVRRFLLRVRAADAASAILLVRPAGVATCRLFEIQALQQRARHGRIPIPESGDLDFSAWPGSA